MKLNLDALEVARQRSRQTKNAFAEKLGISSRDMRRMREDKEVSADFIETVAEITGFPSEFLCAYPMQSRGMILVRRGERGRGMRTIIKGPP